MNLTTTIAELKQKLINGETKKMRDGKALYVLVDKSLDPVYGCVQGAHAVAQYLLEHKDTQQWNNEYLIFLYADLESWVHILSFEGLDFSVFHEPDLDNKITALALENDGYIFRHLKLVKQKSL